MFRDEPILVHDILGKIYALTCWRRPVSDDIRARDVFGEDRAYAKQTLRSIAQHLDEDPFNYRLYDAWQMVFQKPWTRPATLDDLIDDLAEAAHNGELFAYMEYSLAHAMMKASTGPGGGASGHGNADGVPDEPGSTMDRPRVPDSAVQESSGWGTDFVDGLSDTTLAMASDIAAEQAELYENTSGWGNVMYPLFKPVEGAGRLVGNTFGLLTGLSPNGMKPEVAQYWKEMGEGFRALGDRVVDAASGDGRAAGEITPALASILVSKRVPNNTTALRETGARRVLDPASLEAWDVVEAKYDAIRANSSDIARIAENTGWPEPRIARIKEHVFFKEHQLDSGLKRFDADPDMFNAWNRLERGDFVDADIDLLRHEIFESKFEGIFETNYRTAHDRTIDSGRTWKPE